MRTAQQTVVEALAFQLRAGPVALQEPSAIRRIGELSKEQAREIAQRLIKERWALDGTRRAPPWPTEGVAEFVALWRRCHDQ